jgi:xylan 1,4-beta-xylosidase
MVAEGGTGYSHAVTVARADHLEGPYEVDPANPMLTSRDRPKLELQKAGHASLVETQSGEPYLVHLCGRPLMPGKRCILGRETAIQKCRWTTDGWLRLADGGNAPAVEVPAPDLPAHPWPAEAARDDFDAPKLGLHFQTLRAPPDESWLSLSERPGWLRLRGRESLSSRHDQSLAARRVQAFDVEAITCGEFEPEDFQQMAGLVCYYDTSKHFYLRVSRDETIGKCLGILACNSGKVEEPLSAETSIEGWPRVWLKAQLCRAELRFYYSPDGRDWHPAGGALDATRLSDEYPGEGSFTGAFVGLAAQDLSGRQRAADFDFFEYRELAAD